MDHEKQEANAIFDGENYREVFERDLLEAKQRIVISSNAISAKKVYDIIKMLKEKQVLGVGVTIVTRAPDDNLAMPYFGCNCMRICVRRASLLKQWKSPVKILRL